MTGCAVKLLPICASKSSTILAPFTRTIHFDLWDYSFLISDISSKSLFLSDPKFPETLKDRSESARIDLFQTLFARYSRLGITKSTDRSVAISGLEKRLADTFRTQSMHGVFEKYLHRSLLWKRSEDTRMKQILYATDKRIPSWSWMAYEGPIKYVPIPFGRVEWHKAVQLRGDVLEAWVTEFWTF